jgi:hypothetical protein
MNENLETALEELNSNLKTKVPLKEVIHSSFTMGGEVFLSKTHLAVRGHGEVSSHWYTSPQKVPDFFASIQLEGITRIFSTNNRKDEVYKEFCKVLKLDYKTRIAVVVAVFKTKEGKETVRAFAPKADSDFKKEALNRNLAYGMGGIPMTAYDPQVRTANRWVQWIKEGIQNRKIEVLEQSGLVQAWKCGYCSTLNEAEKEKCLHCGAPRSK